jgi:hypothetical protein
MRFVRLVASIATFATIAQVTPASAQNVMTGITATSVNVDAGMSVSVSSYGVLTSATSAYFGIVGAGDSRMGLRPGISRGQDALTQISLQPQFLNHTAYVQNGAVAGSTCAQMTSVYSTNVYPYRPSAQAVTKAFLFILTGINDADDGASLATWQSCYRGYINQAAADGFTPILVTIYYFAGATVTADLERQSMNTWIRAQQQTTVNGQRIGIVDLDARLLPNSTSPWYGSATSTVNVTGYSISSGVATIAASNSKSTRPPPRRP